MTLRSSFVIDVQVVKLLSRKLARHYRIIAAMKERNVVILVTDIKDLLQEDELAMALDFPFELRQISSEEVEDLLQQYYFGERDLVEGDRRSLQQLNLDSNFLDQLIWDAKQLRSSDIHIESFESKGRVRIRIDGLMVERYVLDKADYPALVNKIKILSSMDIAEKRLPQDGRIQYAKDDEHFDIRVSVLPTLHGEKVVLRLLNNDSTSVQIRSLGMSKEDLANYLVGVRKTHGIVLISGPTGSGKTTTLYATLKHLNKDTTNILTIEDPIEYTLEGVNQVQLRENIGLTFGAALRTFLRQDPDIIMVGEIRDPDTANMAIRAALTGHLVLSTIHTNSAWGTVSRLIDMGIPDFLIANTLNTTVAQRLIRLLCPHCKLIEPMNNQLYPKQFKPFYEVAQHAIAKGCQYCYFTGFKGRKAVYEIIPIDGILAEEIKHGNMQVDTLLHERNIKTLRENAFDLFASQQTTMKEIYPLLFNY